MPKRLVLVRPGDVAAAHPEDHATWRRCGQRLTQLQQDFPHARFRRVIRMITELDEHDFRRLQLAAAWLRDHPTSGMLLRQLPIEGIHTKWLAQHATLVLALLGDDHHAVDDTDDVEVDQQLQLADDQQDAGTEGINIDGTRSTGSRRRLLHARLGLRVPPDLVQVSVCDPRLRAQVGGMRHFAASVEDLNYWQARPTAVAILENKETGYAVVEDLPGAVILHGHGRYIEQYARIEWVRSAPHVVCWGDLDMPGLQFVSDLRAHGIHAKSVLTDRETLERYRHLSVPGAAPETTAMPAYLTEPELELYKLLFDHFLAYGCGLLLEQERIPWSDASPALRAAVTGIDPA